MQVADELKIFSPRNIKAVDKQIEPFMSIWLIGGTGVAKYRES